MPTSRRTLGTVASALGLSLSGGDAAIDDVHHDSRRVGPGSLFVAVSGAVADGHDHAGAAVSAGATALIVERELALDVPQLVVADSRSALAVAAAVVHGHPSRSLRVVGITGTNGKTSVAHMVDAIATHAGLHTGVMGTLGARIAGEDVTLDRTTPESTDLQRLLSRMAGAGVDVVSMEVSSHALALHRVDAVRFRVVAFTNLSQDHLDFHGDMTAYFNQKATLFTPERAFVGVVWIDDAWAARLAAESTLPIIRVGHGDDADVSGVEWAVDARGSSFTLRAAGRAARVRIPVPARFNTANALLASAICLELDLDFDDVCRGLEKLPQVPGRFEAVPGPWGFQVVVDYAHTPDAVAAAIAEARSITAGRVLALVGAGGDRDQDKRPLMGAAAGSADVTFVTSDNPRSEDPATIVAAVAGGVPTGSTLVVAVDRRAAIRAVLAEARDDDMVLILGKGHEQGQEFFDGRIEPFDDRVVALEEGRSVLGGGP